MRSKSLEVDGLPLACCDSFPILVGRNTDEEESLSFISLDYNFLSSRVLVADKVSTPFDAVTRNSSF